MFDDNQLNSRICRLRLVLTREAGFKLISGGDGQEKMQIRESPCPHAKPPQKQQFTHALQEMTRSRMSSTSR